MNEKSKCIICGKEFYLNEDGWCEVDDGDLCPACAAEMDYDERLDD